MKNMSAVWLYLTYFLSDNQCKREKKQIHSIKPRLRWLIPSALFSRQDNGWNHTEGGQFASRFYCRWIRLISLVGAVGYGVTDSFGQNGCNGLPTLGCGATAARASIVRSLFAPTFIFAQPSPTVIPSAVTDTAGQTWVRQSSAERMNHSMFRHCVKHDRPLALNATYTSTTVDIKTLSVQTDTYRILITVTKRVAITLIESSENKPGNFDCWVSFAVDWIKR